MVLQNYQNLIEMTSYMVYIFANVGGAIILPLPIWWYYFSYLLHMTKTNSTDAILATLIVSKTHIIVLTFFRFLFALAVSVKRIYRKVASSSMSRLVARFQIFRRLMKGKFDVYVVWPLTKKFQNWIVDQSTARNFTVLVLTCLF